MSKLIIGFLNNLVRERIPMPNSWQKSMGLSVQPFSQDEYAPAGEITVVAENTGYAFLDKLQRGYISHKHRTFEYSGDTQYLLGMYLRALKKMTGMNLMPFYNCVNEIESKVNQAIFHAPIVAGEAYSIYCDTTFPITMEVVYTNTNSIIFKKQIRSCSSNRPFVYDTSVIESMEGYDENSLEYLELRFTTRGITNLSVIEGTYAEGIDMPIIGQTITAKSMTYTQIEAALFPRIAKPFRIEFFHTNSDNAISDGTKIPFTSYPTKYWSKKLLTCLLGHTVTNESNQEIKSDFQSRFTNKGATVEDTVKMNSTGLYDINGYSDNRVKW